MNTMKKWKKDEIKDMIEKSDYALIKGLLRIYENQTMDEKRSESTSHDNGIGFNGSDAEFLSKMAKFFLDRGYLTGKQIDVVRKKMLKYSGQLTKIANTNEAKKLQTTE